mgnify:CR=1 FL=1
MTTMTPLRFAAIIRAQFPDLLGKRLLIALSGGADSVALLHLLHEVAPQLAMVLYVAHVHHHLRGGQADADAAWCARLCEALALEFQVLHLDQPTPPRGVSPEAWWRQERYRLLRRAADEQRCAAVLTAHTRDDQAETVLLKLLAGGGPRAVAGIRLRSEGVARPLLYASRAELRSFLSQRALSWREDATNRDTRQPRAWVRECLLPLLEARFPRCGAHLASFAADLASDEEVLGELLAHQAQYPKVGGAVDLSALRELPAALLARWTLQLAGQLPLREPPSRAQLNLVATMIHRGHPAGVDLGGRWVLRRRGERLYLLPPPCLPFAGRDASGTVVLPGGWRATLGVSAAAAAAHIAHFDAAILAAHPMWRSVRRGEGWPERDVRSLAKALAKAGVPAPWRPAWPLLEADGSIVWVPAVGVAAKWAAVGGSSVTATLEEPWQRQ